MSGSFVVEEQFRGPPQSGNGGYVTGIVASLLTEARPASSQLTAAEVTLRAPVPLGRKLNVQRDAEQLHVTDDGRLIVEARLTTLEMSVPTPASYEEALAMRATSAALVRGEHRFLPGERVGFHPICFCCGAELAPERGLHVYAAPVPERAQVAAAWTPSEHFASSDGTLPPEIVCTALDCPGQFAWLATGVRTGMLGRMTPRIERSVQAGERCVVIGWTMGQEGKKFFAGTALFNEKSELCAYARAVWIGRVD